MNIGAKPTLYGGVQFRSRLEARFAEMLHHQKIDWEYEPETYLFGTYLPDFYLPYVGQNGLFIEIKPRKFTAELEMFWDKIWSSSGAWICVDKSDGWRSGWILTERNKAFSGRVKFCPAPTPVSFHVLTGKPPRQALVIDVERAYFASDDVVISS